MGLFMGQSNLAGQPTTGVTRRHFMKMAIATGALAAAGPRVWAAEGTSEIPKRELGRTGERVSCIGLGGSHIGKMKDEAESLRIIRTAIDRGLTFMDNSWDYNDGDGVSETRIPTLASELGPSEGSRVEWLRTLLPHTMQHDRARQRLNANGLREHNGGVSARQDWQGD